MRELIQYRPAAETKIDVALINKQGHSMHYVRHWHRATQFAQARYSEDRCARGGLWVTFEAAPPGYFARASKVAESYSRGLVPRPERAWF